MIKCFKALFLIVVFPLLTLLTGCDSEGAFSGTTAKLERIDISASPLTTRGVSQLTLAAGNEQAFEAIGYYSDGSSRALTDLSVSDWHTSDQDVGYFNDPGVLIGGDTPGMVTVTATKDGITSNTMNVTVTAAVITAIQVTPATANIAKGQARQLTATATYSDSTSSDVTSSVTWTVDATATATVSPAGLLSGVEVGSATVTATKDGITSNTVNVTVTAAFITAIQVTPATVNIAKGQAQQLTATATYSDSTSSDVTSSVTWTVDATATATVSPAGLLSGVEVGSATVTATKDGITSNTVNVTVTAAVITAIQVTPATANIAKGQARQLTATATYSDSTSSDVTSSVTWTVDATATATVSPAGLLSGVEVGSATVTATKDGITSNTVNVTVTAAFITAIQVTPATVNIAKGQAQQLTATATYSDSTSSDVTSSVTWTVDATATATVSPAGLLSGVEVGSTTVTATKDGVSSHLVIVEVNISIAVCGNIFGNPIDTSPVGGINNTDKNIAAENCLKIRQVIDNEGGKKWFTSSPSFDVIDELEYLQWNSSKNTGDSVASFFEETGFSGPEGWFARFRQDGENIDMPGINGQYDRWCQKLSTLNFAGRSNWRRSGVEELQEMFDYENITSEGLYDRFGWPTGVDYWTSTVFEDKYQTLFLDDWNFNFSHYSSRGAYVSCVSEI
ncbi:Ig-like domain-containing protein [Vibrio metschnikovii]|uniref:Ig-like domain-containing protein n=1 Tax=Vibrio metschnikovii TaxID=28172 RepID=UPI001C2FE05A|nr:Ig-like domain-containing protein [Vibrio metschnikovii]